VKKKILDINWTKLAEKQLSEVLEYVNKESPSGGQKIANELISWVNSAASHPLMNPVDSLARNNRNWNNSLFHFLSLQSKLRCA
jgi:hypothetical protein